MSTQEEEFPNWEQRDDSPSLTVEGVSIRMTSQRVKIGEPVVLRGAYRISGKLMQTMADAPLTWLLVIVVRRDKPEGVIKVAQDGHNQPAESASPPIDDPSVFRGGFFNLELKEMSGIIREAGRYWVMTSLGDFVSNRLEFEVVD